MKLIISTHFFFLSKIVKAFLLIKCHAKGFARERGEGIRAGAGNYETYNFYSFFLFIKNSKSFFVNQVPREGIRAGAGGIF